MGRKRTLPPGPHASYRTALVEVAAHILSLGGQHRSADRVALLMGASRWHTWAMLTGRISVTTRTLAMLADGLRDMAVRCERLADMVDRELADEAEAGAEAERLAA